MPILEISCQWKRAPYGSYTRTVRSNRRRNYRGRGQQASTPGEARSGHCLWLRRNGVRSHRTPMPYHRLVTRAIEIENSGAGPMMTRWQSHCQQRWLERARPKKVVWPWENFAWERELCRAMHRLKIPAIGYQHTVVGRHQINFCNAAEPGRKVKPAGQNYMQWPCLQKRTERLGPCARNIRKWRRISCAPPPQIPYDESAPVYFALSASTPIALEQITAARMVADTGRHVLVREHPMYPVPFRESKNLHRAKGACSIKRVCPLLCTVLEHPALEALLAGLPTVRFQPDDRVAVQILPAGLNAVDVTRATIIETLHRPQLPAPVEQRNCLRR